MPDPDQWYTQPGWTTAHLYRTSIWTVCGRTADLYLTQRPSEGMRRCGQCLRRRVAISALAAAPTETTRRA